MPITFSIHHDRGYYISKYQGKITDAEQMNAYKEFFEGEEWVPGLNELSDLSEASLAKLTSQGIRNLEEYGEHVFRAHSVQITRTAVYAPKDLPFGLARMYEAMSDASPERVRVFRTLPEAKKWIEQE